VNNSIRYESPEWSGLRGGALAGLGETSGNTGGNRLLETWGRFASGSFSTMASLLDDKGGPANGNAARRVITLGATYAFGSIRAMGGYLDVNDRSVANQDGTGYWLGADYTFDRQKLRAQYVQSKPKNVSDAKTQALGIGWEYMLSKRTSLFTSLTRYQNQDGAGLGRAWFALPTGLTTASRNDINELIGGIHFSF
jgi:predicted porin